MIFYKRTETIDRGVTFIVLKAQPRGFIFLLALFFAIVGFTAMVREVNDLFWALIGVFFALLMVNTYETRDLMKARLHKKEIRHKGGSNLSFSASHEIWVEK